MPTEEAVKYIGSQKIKEYNELNDRIQYTLENGAGDTVTKQQFESMAKAEAYDDGLARVYKWTPAIHEVLEIFLKNDMRVVDRSFVLGRIDESIINSYDKASAILYGVDYEHNIGLKEIHKALTGKRIANSVESLSTEDSVDKTKTETETSPSETVGN